MSALIVLVMGGLSAAVLFASTYFVTFHRACIALLQTLYAIDVIEITKLGLTMKCRTPVPMCFQRSPWPGTRLSIVSILMIGVSMSACSNSTSWKEEVLLHDGKKIIVERSTTRDADGRREIGQHAPMLEQTLTFTPSGTTQSITWKSDFGQTSQDNLTLLALEVVSGKSYIVTEPNCISYNKWGRPNPPYVIFKYEGTAWRRIAVDALPSEVVRANVIIGSYDDRAVKLGGMGIDVNETKSHVSAGVVDRLNQDLGNENSVLRMRLFIRKPIKWEGLAGDGMGCDDPAFSSAKSPVFIPPPSQ